MFSIGGAISTLFYVLNPQSTLRRSSTITLVTIALGLPLTYILRDWELIKRWDPSGWVIISIDIGLPTAILIYLFIYPNYRPAARESLPKPT